MNIGHPGITVVMRHGARLIVVLVSRVIMVLPMVLKPMMAVLVMALVMLFRALRMALTETPPPKKHKSNQGLGDADRIGLEKSIGPEDRRDENACSTSKSQ